MHQKLILIGNLGKDPEMRYTPSGQAVTNFSMATTRQYTNSNGEPIKETCWFRVSVWGKAAEACSQYLRKGSKVYVEAHLTPDKETGGPRVWTKQDGTFGSSFEASAELVRFLTPRGEGQPAQEPVSGAVPEEDVPF